MKIQINGTYCKADSLWKIELPSLSIKVVHPNPFKAFKKLEELIQLEIGLGTHCTFKISDDGHFELNTDQSPEFVNYISCRLAERATKQEELTKMLNEIRFRGDLDD